MKIRSFLQVAALTLATGVGIEAAIAADATPAPSTAPAAVATSQPDHNTVGVDVIKTTTNPDQTLTLLYQWKDRDGKQIQRSVIVNHNTVIGVDGQVKTMADLTPDVLRK